MDTARYVGRLGGLAVALGIGIGVGAAAGTANADDSAVSNSSRTATSTDASEGGGSASRDRDESPTSARDRSSSKPTSSRVSAERGRTSDEPSGDAPKKRAQAPVTTAEPDLSPAPVRAQDPTIPDVPSEARTVITIGGLGSEPEETGDYLQGFPKAEGNTWIPLVYPAAARQSSITQGAANLDRLLRSTSGFVDVIGMSQGAQVVGEWLSSFAERDDAPDPARIRFTLLGNPSRRLGSNPNLMGWNFRRLALTPEDTAYTVRDIAKRWDGWANWENWPNLTRDSGAELIRLFLGMFTDHRQYDDVDVSALVVRAVVGNTTYYVAT